MIYTYTCVCVTPEPSTKHRMSLERRDAAGALLSLGQDDGPGGGAAGALMAMCAGVLASSGVHPVAKLAFVAIAITYVLWRLDC
jgi:hypothetical protein